MSLLQQPLQVCYILSESRPREIPNLLSYRRVVGIADHTELGETLAPIGFCGEPRFGQQAENSLDVLEAWRPDSEYESDVTKSGSISEESNKSEAEPDSVSARADRTASPIPKTQRSPLPAGKSIGTTEPPWDTGGAWNPWQPFKTELDFKLAQCFVETQTPKSRVNSYFNYDLCSETTGSFMSGYILRKLINSMQETLGSSSWTAEEADFGHGAVPYYYHNPVEVVAYLLRQRSFTGHMAYAPVKQYNADGEQIYSEMWTAYWWWETQVGSF